MIGQIQLCALLRHRERGDFASFRRIAEIVAPAFGIVDGFLAWNLFVTASIAGQLTPSYHDGRVRWVAHCGDEIVTNGWRPKRIPTRTRHLVRGRKELALASTPQGQCIVSGYSEQGDACSLFGEPFADYMPSFHQVEKTICQDVAWDSGLLDDVEQFNFREMRWIPAQRVEHVSFVRRVDRFGVRREYVVFPESRTLFRLRGDDWSFLAAQNLLGSLIPKSSFVRTDCICIPAAFRLPTLLLRFLFASSASVSVGREIVFIQPATQAVDVFNRIVNTGDSHAS
jgi:hypothetical protein